MRSRLESIGVYTPEKVVTTGELMQRMEHPMPFPIDLEGITGIRSRRWRTEEDSSYSLVMKASLDCLRKSRYRAEDLDIIISTSITRTMKPACYYFDPALSSFIKHELGARDARHFDINNACSGMMTGAYVLDSMIRAGTVRNGLVVSGECITPIAETALREISHPFDEQFASLTVGDAGAAFVMDAAPNGDEGIDYIEFTTLADYSHLCIGRPSDISAGVAMFTKSKEMHESGLVRPATKFIHDMLSRHGFTAGDYDYIITHQVTVGAVKQYLKSLCEVAGVPDVPTLMVVQDYGNTASTSHSLVLYQALKEKKLSRGSKIAIITTASGIQVGVVSLTLGELEV